MNSLARPSLAIVILALSVACAGVQAQDWSLTEVQFQYGNLEQVGTDGATADTTIFTVHHADGWKYGSNFFFVDHLDYNSDHDGKNPFNPGSDGSELYGEWYSTFSLSSITGCKCSFGPIKDIGILAGLNWAPEVDSWWFLPGLNFSLDLPGFAFANLYVTAFQQHSTADDNATNFVIHDEDDSWHVDFNWARPFRIGKTRWSIEGHMEYITGRDQRNTFGTTRVHDWFLAQPQLRFDLGDVLWQQPGQLFVGIEYQYWKNKLGEKGTNDNTAQLLVVWHF